MGCSPYAHPMAAAGRAGAKTPWRRGGPSAILPAMSATKHDREQEAAPHHSGNPSHVPYWQRAHRDPIFWLGAVLVLVAMMVYVTSINLSQPAGRPPQPAMPAAAS